MGYGNGHVSGSTRLSEKVNTVHHFCTSDSIKIIGKSANLNPEVHHKAVQHKITK